MSPSLGLSDLVRQQALAAYIRPALQAGKSHVSISVRELLNQLIPLGFPAANVPQICTALRAKKFLLREGLQIESIDGPPRLQGTTVVIHYRLAAAPAATASAAPPQETAEEWAHRMSEKLRGLLKEELAEYGGGEAFLNWIRSDGDEEPPTRQTALLDSREEDAA